MVDEIERTDETGAAEASRPQMVVRCGSMRALHIMTGRELFPRGTPVIARTPRGLEVGEVLCEATPQTIEYMGPDCPTGQVQRQMSAEDQNEVLHLRQQAESEFGICQEHIDRLGLKMDLVDVERIFGGERVVVYYLAESRVDFRQLVRDLAAQLRCRVEMRQIGVRDEAKLLADYGDCGKPVCCNTHLSEMPPVTMKMAKLQKATLDPTKISGRCGRLKCCLRYEYDTYEEISRDLPEVGSVIVTESGKSTVLGQEILARQLLVMTEDNRRILINGADVLSVIRRAPRRKSKGSRRGSGAGSATNGNKEAPEVRARTEETE